MEVTRGKPIVHSKTSHTMTMMMMMMMTMMIDRNDAAVVSRSAVKKICCMRVGKRENCLIRCPGVDDNAAPKNILEVKN